jgi:allantoin racemase
LTTPRRRILVVNPNTSEAVTATFLEALRDITPDDVDLTGVTGTFGAKIVTREAENIVAAYCALELVAQHTRGRFGWDAVILAISFDSGLKALQSLLPCPVVGITQATLRAAAQGGRRVGVLFLGEASRALYERVIAGYGITPVGSRAIDFASVEDFLRPDTKDQAIREAILALTLAGAEAIALLGTVIAGTASRLQTASDVPLYDGLSALALCLEPTPSIQEPQGPLGPTQNLSPDLTELIAGACLKP